MHLCSLWCCVGGQCVVKAFVSLTWNPAVLVWQHRRRTRYRSAWDISCELISMTSVWIWIDDVCSRYSRPWAGTGLRLQQLKVVRPMSRKQASICCWFARDVRWCEILDGVFDASAQPLHPNWARGRKWVRLFYVLHACCLVTAHTSFYAVHQSCCCCLIMNRNKAGVIDIKPSYTGGEMITSYTHSGRFFMREDSYGVSEIFMPLRI